MGMVVIQPYILVSKLKKIKTKFLRCTGYLNSIKNPYEARFIANSRSCTTTELSKLLTSCLTAVKKHVIKYCEKVYERSGKNLFWSIKDFNATSLSTYDFSTLYTAFFTSERPKKYHAWSCQNVCGALTFLLDNIFIRFSTKLYFKY